MMLEFLGETGAADRITKAVAEHRQLTESPTKGASTSQIGDAIAERV
jgi:isocitrate/isopropylmalate dehydrogenase